MHSPDIEPFGFVKHGTNAYMVPNIRGFIWTPYYNARNFSGVSNLGIQITRVKIGDRTFSMSVGLARSPIDSSPYLRIVTVHELVDGVPGPRGLAIEGDCLHPVSAHSKGAILRRMEPEDVARFEEHAIVIKNLLDALESYGARTGCTVDYGRMISASEEGLFDDVLSQSLHGDCATNVKNRWDQNSIELVEDLDFEIGVGIPYEESYVEGGAVTVHDQVQPHEPVSISEISIRNVVHMLSAMGFVHTYHGNGPANSSLEIAIAKLFVRLTVTDSGQVLFVYDPLVGHTDGDPIRGAHEFDLVFRPNHNLGEIVLRGRHRGKTLYRLGSLFWGEHYVDRDRRSTDHGEVLSMYYYQAQAMIDAGHDPFVA